MSWASNFPIVRITLCLVGGIICAAGWSLSSEWLWIIWGLLLICYLGLLLGIPPHQFYKWSAYIGGLGLSAMFWAGALCRVLYIQHDDNLAPYVPHVEAYVAVALEEPKSQDDRTAVTVAVQQVYAQGSWHEVTGKVRLHIKGKLRSPARYGDVYLILGYPKLVDAPLNPHTFNYQAFLKQQKIDYQQRVSATELHPIRCYPPNQLLGWLYQVRHFCQVALTKHLHDPHVRGIVLALVLGVKDELDEGLRGAYAGAGTLHVLAVSGLHVGILYGLLSFLVYGRKRSPSKGWIRPFLICLGLWVYAGVTGLTPSILRAVWMLSLVALGKLAGKQGNIYNILATSAFVLLLWNPLLIYSVSFQLSYLAVWGIVYLQPKIYHWLHFKSPILRYLWMGTSISLAAQIATTPISLYYFHQFPTYFIIANWVVVPAAFLIFSLGLAALLTSGCDMLNGWVAWLLEQVTTLVNQFVVGINQLPCSVVEDIYLSKWQVGLWYGVLGSILLFCHIKTFRSFILASIVAFMLAISNLWTTLQQRSQQGMVLYSVYPQDAVAFVQGTHSWLLVDKALQRDTKQFDRQIKPSLLARGVDRFDSYTLAEVIRLPHLPWQEYQRIKIGYWGGKRLIIIDQPGIQWPLWNTKVSTDYLIIKGNSINSLEPLLAQFEWGTLVIGSSNRQQLVAKLQKEAQQLQISNYHVCEQGALEVDW